MHPASLPRLTTSLPPTPPNVSSPQQMTPQSTNTLIITGMPPSFFHPLVLNALRDHFVSYGEIFAWAPITAFRRVILVYHQEEAAEHAKRECDGFTVEATSQSPRTILRVYRADPTPIISSPSSTSGEFSPHHLRPPPIEKNFLISPPGSPPIGWEQIKEEPPNAAPLAEDLINALRKLQIARDIRRDGNSGSSISVLVEPDEATGVGVYVEDCDMDDDQDKLARAGVSSDGAHEEPWLYGALSLKTERTRFVPIPTSRPAMYMTA